MTAPPNGAPAALARVRLWPVTVPLLGALVQTPLVHAGDPAPQPLGSSWPQETLQGGSSSGDSEQGMQGARMDPDATARLTVLRAEDPRAWRSAQSKLTLSLEQTLELALQNNLDLSSALRQTEIARLDALGSWGAFDPVLSLRGSLTDRERPGSTSLAGANVLEEDSQNLNASLVWPVQTGGQISVSYDRSNDRTNNQFAVFDVSTTDVVTAQVTQPLLRGAWSRFATTDQRQAEVTLQRQRAAEEQVRQQLLRDVYDAYWDLVSARDQFEVRIVTYELGLEQQRQDERRLEVGAGTEVDVLQSETNVAQSWEQLLQAGNSVIAAEDALRRLLFQESASRAGDEIDELLASWDWPIEPTTAFPDIDPEDLPSMGAEGTDSELWRRSLALALASRPELAQARFDVEAAEVQLERARSNRRAQLDLELSASSVGFDTDPNDAFSQASGFDFPEYTGALVFSLPLGNRTARNAERSARAALRNAELQADIAELAVLTDVRNAVRELRYRAIAALAAEASSDLAQRQLAAEQARQQNGLSTTFQVLEFQQTLSEALSTERAARAAYAKALAGLRFAEGVLQAAVSEADDEE